MPFKIIKLTYTPIQLRYTYLLTNMQMNIVPVLRKVRQFIHTEHNFLSDFEDILLIVDFKVNNNNFSGLISSVN